MLFEPNSRIEKNSNGIRFYEQDILFSDYVFEDDVEIDLHIDYLHPGFGIVIAEKYKGGPRNSEKAHLFKLGNNVFRVFEKTILTQVMRKENACLLAPDQENQDINLIFRITGRDITLLQKTVELKAQKPKYEELGTYKLTKRLNEYYIGFYSNKGNTLRDVTFLQGAPKNWITSIHNTRGGRISFIQDGFRFEKCEHDAELEQDDIELEPGTYYVAYDKEAVDGKYDIDCYVFPSKLKEVEDKYFEDDYKNLLHDGKFQISEKTAVDLKFNGTNGLVKNISIKDDPLSAFVETYDTPLTIEGSYVRVTLDNLSKILWSGVIHNVPDFKDYTKPCPYAVAETVGRRLTLDDLNIKTETAYNYEFTVESKTVHAIQGKYETGSASMPFAAADKNKLTLFHNMNAVITRLILVDKDGKQIDVLRQKTFKRYVPEEIAGPILVRDDKRKPLDLSSSYREVAKEEYRIEFFKGSYEMTLSCPPVDHAVKVYGIPFGTTVNVTATDIQEYAPNHEEISDSRWELKGRVLSMDAMTRKKYQGIAIRYRSAETFTYLFTNYERETFIDEPRIVLEKPMADVSGGVMVYGCQKEPDKKHLYRVPSAEMVNSIDLCCDNYDLIPETLLELNYADNEIKFTKELRERYPYLIIDYLKADSYAINYRPDLSLYEVDISMECPYGYLGYDMNEDGSVDTRKRTVIKPDKNKFIILRRKSGEFD